MQTTVDGSYRVSERVTLARGDVFRAKGGPYWQCDDGTKTKLSAPGPFKFIQFCKRGSREWIEATDKNGHFCVLRVSTGRWSKIDGDKHVPRPYIVTGKKRRKKRDAANLSDQPSRQIESRSGVEAQEGTEKKSRKTLRRRR
jgi:hypothetical protein